MAGDQSPDVILKPMISIIVAVAENGVIGDKNALLWHISEDLKHFKSVTTGHPVVMGRKTFGGAQIYAEALPLARRFYLTRVFRAYEGDTKFPAWDENEWRPVSSESFPCGKDYPWPFAFELYERR